MREGTVERALKDAAEKAGGFCLKFVSPGMRGVPDRLLLMPNGKKYFVELKRPGEVPRPDQLLCHKRFARLGHNVAVIDTPEKARKFILDIVNNKR